MDGACVHHEEVLSGICAFISEADMSFILHIVICIILSHSLSLVSSLCVPIQTPRLPSSYPYPYVLHVVLACIILRLYAWGKWIERFLSIIWTYTHKYIVQVMCHFTGKLLLLLSFHLNRATCHFALARNTRFHNISNAKQSEEKSVRGVFLFECVQVCRVCCNQVDNRDRTIRPVHTKSGKKIRIALHISVPKLN